MNPPRGPVDWQQVDALFSELLEESPAKRSALLAERCGDDAVLRATLQRLLDTERRSAGLFEAAAPALGELVEAALQPPDRNGLGSDLAPQQIGPFRLIRPIGSGGMSVVWLAERADGDFEQVVAVKLLRHWLHGEDARQRFLAERRILSSLSHPGIAPLIDGGATADGTLWLATEYVSGEPLTTHCDARKLDVEQRLDLFTQVADAVHYAHQQLVIHRDLKPSNILVDARGRTRLLDFGIAKLLEPDPAAVPLTRTGLWPMTPEYAAPEQLLGGPITTATDIYQLGVLLYELLSGERPPSITSAGTLGTTRAGPSRPSAVIARRTGRGPHESERRLAARLRGDLDVIVLKALDEDALRRYPSAAALAEDLRNHLRGRAIMARPDSSLRVVRRFMRRNPLGGAAIGLAAAALLGLIVTLQFTAVEVARERDAAQREAARANQVKELLLGLFRGADPMAANALRGRETTIWESVEAATATMRQDTATDPRTRAELLATLATLHHYSGGLDEGARLLAEAVELYREHSGDDSAAYAVTLAELGLHWARLGRLEDAAAAVGEALERARRLPDEQRQAALPAVLIDAADVMRANADLREAEALYREALALHPVVDALDSGRGVAAYNGLAEILLELDRFAEAETIAMAAVRELEQALGPDHALLIVPLSVQGRAQRSLGRPADAVASLRRGLPIVEREYGTEFESALNMRSNLALALAAVGETELAVEGMQTLLGRRRASLGAEHPEVGNTLQNLAVMYVMQGRFEEALATLDEAQRVYSAVLPAGHFRHAFPLLTRAFIQLRLDQTAAAEATAAAAGSLLGDQLPADHFARGVAGCLVGEALLRQGHYSRAAGHLEAALPAVQNGRESLLPYVENCQSAQQSLQPALTAGAREG